MGCQTDRADPWLNLQPGQRRFYRALIEGTAFGTYAIIELFKEAGISISRLQAGGGLTQNDLILKIYSDVDPSSHRSGGRHSFRVRWERLSLARSPVDFYPSIDEAVKKMVLPSAKIVMPTRKYSRVIPGLFRIYQQLAECLGRDPHSPMKLLFALSR